MAEKIDLLKYGLKYSIHPLPLYKKDILANFDFILRKMINDLIKGK